MERSKKFILISLIIHAILFGSLGPKGCGSGSGGGRAGTYTGGDSGSEKGANKDINVDIIEKPNKSEVEQVKDEKKDEKADIVTQQMSKPKRRECDKWFGGVGIQITFQNPLGTEITQVYSGYPADEAGLRAGDIILWVDSKEIRGEPGTTVKMIILRGGQELHFSIVRDRICY